MKNEVLNRANEIKKSIDTLYEMRRMIGGGFLRIFKDKIGFMSNDNDYLNNSKTDVIYFYELDNTTKTKITDAIKSIITERIHELEEEYNNL